MGAETSTTPTTRVASPNIAPTQRGAGPLIWTTSAGLAEAGKRKTATPAPRLRQLMAVCGWAAVLGGVGLVIGIRGFIGVLAGDPPGWFEPAMMAVGFLGIALTVGAFLTVHRNRAPFALLGGASVVLVASMVLTTQAF